MARIRIALCTLTCLIAACAPGGTNVSPGGAAGVGAPGVGPAAATRHMVILDLSKVKPHATKYGEAGGIDPYVLTVNVGDSIEFKNDDTFTHTSSYLGHFTKFPKSSPLTAKALVRKGDTLSGGWTSGPLKPGSSSQVVRADKAGTYLYGCFFHYPSPMRAAIVAR